MPGQFLEDDLGGFFNVDEFAHAATFSALAEPVNGVYNNAYEAEDVLDMEFSGTAPTFTCATSDLTGVSEGQQVTVAGILHRITDMQESGTGHTTVVLVEE